MPSNKDRLYVGLYFRGGGVNIPGQQDTYHWALLTGPKLENDDSFGMRYHIVDRPKPPSQKEWAYQELRVPAMGTQRLLARILVGKVKNTKRLIQVLRNVPLVQDDSSWTCRVWVKDALEALGTDRTALGTCNIEWTAVRDTAIAYVQEKKRQDYYEVGGGYDPRKAPTYDLLERKEKIQ